MSKSLVRFVDEAILPVFLIIATKLFAIAALNNLLSLSFYYQHLGQIYYKTEIDALLVNSWSDFAVFLIIFLGICFILMKLLFFTDNKTSPSLLLKLVKANSLGLLTTSIEIYQTLIIWILYFSGITIYYVFRVISGNDYIWFLLPIGIIFLGVVWIVIKEVEKDIWKKLERGIDSLT